MNRSLGRCTDPSTLLRPLLLGLLALAACAAFPGAALAINYVTTANGTTWQINDGAAPDVDTGSIRQTQASAPSGFGGIRVDLVGTEPEHDGELVRGFGLRYDGGEDFKTTEAVWLGPVRITRQLHLEKAEDWGRWTDSFTNLGKTPLTLEVAFGGWLGAGVAPGALAAVADSSDGDAAIEAGDAWATVDTPTPAATTPTSGPSTFGPVATVFGSPGPFAGGLDRTTNIDRDPFSTPLPSSGFGANTHGYVRKVVLAPGETKSLVTFVVIGLSESQDLTGAGSIPAAGSEIAAVSAAAEDLAETPDLAGLTDAEICGISNFDVESLTIPGFDFADCAAIDDPSLDPQPAPPAFETSSPYDVVNKTIAELQADMESGATTSQEITRAYLDRIAAYDVGPWGLHSFIAVAADAMGQAKQADVERSLGRTGTLLGIPVALKDNYDTKDLPTTGGSLALEGYVPPRDAFQVARMRAAGAVILGKLNMAEFAYSGSFSESGYGATWNAFNPSKTPLGSSGGTGTAGAASLAAFTMGTDTCRSLIGTSSAASLATIRTTYGLTSRDGILPLLLAQDTGGPMTRSIADLATVLDVTAGSDPAESITAEADARKPQTFHSYLDPNALQGVTLGYFPEWFDDDTHGTTSQRDAALAKLAVMEAAGAEVVEITTAPPPVPYEVEGTDGNIWNAVVDGFNKWLVTHPDAPIASGSALWSSPLALPTNRNTGTLPGLTEEEWEAYENRRKKFAGEMEAWMDGAGLDAVVYPGLTGALPDADSSQFAEGGECSNSAVPGLPSVVVPAGLDSEGEPNNMEFLGRNWEDATLIGYAYAFEQQLGDGQHASPAQPALAYDPDANPQPIEIPTPEQPSTQRPAGEAPALDLAGAAGKLSLLSKKLRLDGKGRIRLTVGCSGLLPCGVSATLKAGKQALASKVRTVPAGGRAKLVLKLKGRALERALAASKLRVVLLPVGPSNGSRVSKVLTLR